MKPNMTPINGAQIMELRFSMTDFIDKTVALLFFSIKLFVNIVSIGNRTSSMK